MKTLKARDLGDDVQIAQLRLAGAERNVTTAKARARLAKRRRKEAKEAARRARKQLKRAKTELASAEEALAAARKQFAENKRGAVAPLKIPNLGTSSKVASGRSGKRKAVRSHRVRRISPSRRANRGAANVRRSTKPRVRRSKPALVMEPMLEEAVVPMPIQDAGKEPVIPPTAPSMIDAGTPLIAQQIALVRPEAETEPKDQETN